MDGLETARLQLRRFTMDDLAAYTEIRRQCSFCRYLPGGEAAAADAEKRARQMIKQCLRQYAQAQMGTFAVIAKNTGQLIGHGGLRRLEKSPDDELLYGLQERFWGQGLATELCRAVLAARRQDAAPMTTVKAMVMIENHASMRVLEKLGFSFEKQINYFGTGQVAFYSLAL
jgi:ribosomal-protein-alanine N-acetyltransferase